MLMKRRVRCTPTRKIGEAVDNDICEEGVIYDAIGVKGDTRDGDDVADDIHEEKVFNDETS